MATVTEAFAIALKHYRAGRFESAEEICARIVSAAPDHADALHLLGLIHSQTGRQSQAVLYLERAVAASPLNALYRRTLGTAHYAMKNATKAIVCYQRALQLAPDDHEAYNQLGMAFRHQRELDQAIACYERALELKPDCTEACNNLANAFRAQGKLDEAEIRYRRALQLRPDFAEAYANLGAVLQDQGKLDQAVACCRQACQRNPRFAGAYRNQGSALLAQGRLEEAIVCLRRALELVPDWAAACNDLGAALLGQGKAEEAIGCFQKATRLEPGLGAAWSNYLCAIRHRPGLSAAELASEYAAYSHQHIPVLDGRASRSARPCPPERPLRLGFVSPKLCFGPVGAFLIRALENLDREGFPIFCYSLRKDVDAMTARFAAVSVALRDCSATSDDELAALVQADQIDILFDLAGHSPFNRLAVFARRPAPIQITWIDSAGTTGLRAMDYILADPLEIPSEAERDYVEKVLRLPDTYVCFEPPGDAPPTARLPATEKGHVTFGSFNQAAKVRPPVVELWSRVLNRLPESRLLLKYGGFGDRGARDYYTALFAERGISAERLEFQDSSPHAELLDSYHRVDIALDPFYNGGLTTCEALWMGVPVVTCPGETFAGRHSLSHLSNVGFTETIASNLEEYVEVAVGLARDLPRLARIRATLRERMAASPLCDGKRFARNLQCSLRDVWREWCQKQRSGGE